MILYMDKKNSNSLCKNLSTNEMRICKPDFQKSQMNIFNLQKQWGPRTDGARVLIIKSLMFQNVSEQATLNLHFYQIQTENVKIREQKHCAIQTDERVDVVNALHLLKQSSSVLCLLVEQPANTQLEDL